MERNSTRSLLLLLKQYGFTDKTLTTIYENEDSILEVIFDKTHPFYNKYFDIYSLKEKDLARDFNSLVEFSSEFIKKMREYKTKRIKIYYKFSEDFPEYLFTKDKEPLFLYCYGNLELLNKSLRKVSIIGTRNATKAGELITKEIVRDYVHRDWITVSGLAKGIDTIVHQETIDNNAKTIAVIPTSFENIYPAENKKLYAEIINKNGLIISITGPFEHTYKSSFLERNTIVARISNEIFVAEASIKSGTLNTVRKGYENNKTIYYDSSLLNKEVIDYVSRFNAIDVRNKGGR
ncbi:DNA-processing protein DprA [Bacillus toyonensis]|uniref:DNA-processing protein DprA n=1 Tax=Bacillus toyonensis TaxID=155322 RepID=UPI0037F42AF7